MLRRSILALSHRRLSIRRFPRQVSTQVSPFVCSRREFSSVRQQNVSPGPGSTRKPPESGSNLSKILVGTVAIGTCFIAAYSSGYLDDFLAKRQQSSTDPLERSSDLRTEKLPKDNSKEFTERQSVVNPQGESEVPATSSSHLKSKEEYAHAKEEELPIIDEIHAKGEEMPKSSPPYEAADNENWNYQKTENSDDDKNAGQKASSGSHEVKEKVPKTDEASAVIQENNMIKDLPGEVKSEDEPKDVRDNSQESLLDAYSLRDKVDENVPAPSEHIMKRSSLTEEVSHGEFKDVNDASISKDGKLILDFLEAIHAAEKKQAELDARIFAEEKRAMKENFEKELKDARARELMYAEEVAMLEKEVKKERAKAAAAVKSLQERLEQRLKMELEEKNRETESKLKELKDFAKAELAASVAREKAAQVEKMAEADLNINALCMAFYARSEEARQTHSIHKLALGALALEDALSNGLPVQRELEALQIYLDGVDKDSLLQLALSSLPDDVRLHGTDNLLQLHEKFDALKGSLRHFSLIPPNGGGILAHSLARLASFLKVKEGDQTGDGIESVINKVESLLAQGKLVEAANALEDGVKDSKAGEVVSDWVTRVKNRAIAEQALVLLQSYATSVGLS